jgi:CubicO group peptidase (beta-lactamase class C family)
MNEKHFHLLSRNRYFMKKFISIVLLSLFVNSSKAQDKALKIDSLVQKYADNEMFNGSILVAEKGKIIYQKSFGKAVFEWNVPASNDTKYCIGSLSKQFVSILILQLEQEGKLKLSDKLSVYLPQIPMDKANITLEQLLTHTSGMQHFNGLSNFQNTWQLKHSRKEWMDKLAGLPLLNNHGAYNYSGPGYFFLASVVEKLRGMPLAQAYKKYIFNPAGMKNSCSIEEKEVAISKLASGYTPDLYGYRNGRYRDPSTMAGAGDVVTTVGDFHLYDRALRSNLLLSPSQKAKLETPKIESEGYSLTFTRFFSPERKDTATLKFFTGQLQGYTALAYHVLEDDKLIVTFYNVDNPQVWEIGDKLFRILYGVKVKLPGKSIVQFLRNHSRGDINKATAAFISLPEKKSSNLKKIAGN